MAPECWGGCWGGERSPGKGESPTKPAAFIPAFADTTSSLTAEQRACLAELRERLAARGPSEPAPWDHTLLRFLRARRWDVAAALEQFEATQRWRREKDVDRFRRNATGPTGADAARAAETDPRLSSGGVECFPQLRLIERLPREGSWLYFGQCVFFGHDRQGRPLYLQKAGVASHRFGDMMAFGGRETVIDGWVRAQELQAARMEEASARMGQLITKQVVIMDMGGLSYKPDPRALQVFREFLAISARYYPETLEVQFFINTPVVFLGLWRVIRGWLDPVTAAKMHLLGSDYREELLRHIAPDQLPREYGGTNDFDVHSSRHDRSSLEVLFESHQAASAPAVASQTSSASLRRRASGDFPAARGAATASPTKPHAAANRPGCGNILVAAMLLLFACWLSASLF